MDPALDTSLVACRKRPEDGNENYVTIPPNKRITKQELTLWRANAPHIVEEAKGRVLGNRHGDSIETLHRVMASGPRQLGGWCSKPYATVDLRQWLLLRGRIGRRMERYPVLIGYWCEVAARLWCFLEQWAISNHPPPISLVRSDYVLAPITTNSISGMPPHHN
jgi:hypothetical protein